MDPLDQLAAEINGAFATLAAKERCAQDARISVGLQLIEARRRVAAETTMPWKLWCAVHIARSQRDIRRLMRIAGAADPAAAREAEKKRNREAKPTGSRAKGNSVWHCHDQGVGAFHRGVDEADCPYTEPAQHAAWRKGWEEQRDRTGASPPTEPPADVTAPYDRLVAAWEDASEAERQRFRRYQAQGDATAAVAGHRRKAA